MMIPESLYKLYSDGLRYMLPMGFSHAYIPKLLAYQTNVVYARTFTHFVKLFLKYSPVYHGVDLMRELALSGFSTNTNIYTYKTFCS